MIKRVSNWLDRVLGDPQVVVLVLLLTGGFLLIYFWGQLLAPVIAAVVIAYLLDGMVLLLQRLRFPRILAVVVVFCLFVTAALFLIIWLMPMLSRQIVELFRDLPKMITAGQQQLMALPQQYPTLISEAQILEVLRFVSNRISILGQYILSYSLASVKGLISFIVYLILVPLMVFFFLKDKEKIMQWIMSLLPKERKLSIDIWQEVNRQIGNYIRGKIWEIFIVWIASYITFKFLGLQFAMLLSLFVGLSVLIPYIGATFMFLPVTMIGYFQFGWSAHFGYVFLAYTILQILDGNLLVPLLLSGVVKIHPVAIIIAVLVFGGLWGILGLFFAIPLATLVQALLKNWPTQASAQASCQAEKP